jgi:hypothetical protein
MRTRTQTPYHRRRSGARSARLKEGPATIEDQREHRRYAVAQTCLRVTWLDEIGDLNIENGVQPIDVSETGMALQLPASALLFSRVRLESDKGELIGHGKALYCRPKGAGYIVGIEFTESLRWSAPEGAITEPIPLFPPAYDEESTPGADPCALPAAATGFPEDLLWSETLDGRPPEPGPEGGQSADRVEPANASPAPTLGFRPPLEESHLSPNQGAEQGFIARLPMAVKAGAPVLVALALGSFFLGHGRTTPAAGAGDSTASIVGEQGWVSERASDASGLRRGRQLTLYRPSTRLSDYQMQFTGQIESKALGWVFRAADTKNYYGMKIENDKPGSVLYTRFAVVNGRESSVTQKPLPIRARADTAYSVRLEASGPRFSIYIQGEPVELWTDNRLKTGALGFMYEAEESGRTSSVRFSFRNTGGQ